MEEFENYLESTDLFKASSWMEHDALRIMAIFLAELAFLLSDSLYVDLRQRLEPVLGGNVVLLFLASRILFLLVLACCACLFVLNVKDTIRMYKAIVLVSLPIVFEHAIGACHRSLADTSLVFKTLITFLIYAIAISLTIMLYGDIYLECIYHKRPPAPVTIDETTALRRQDSDDEDVIVEDEDEDNELEVERAIINEVEGQAKASFLRRRIFILFYGVLSLVLNESFLLPDSYFELNQVNNSESNSSYWFEFFYQEKQQQPQQQPRPHLKILLLGFLLMNLYDVSTNIDHMVARLAAKVHATRRNISQYGLNNWFTFHWHQRLRVPHLLRLYFAFKTLVFTVSFALDYGTYYALDELYRQEYNNRTIATTSSSSASPMSLFSMTTSLVSMLVHRDTQNTSLDSTAALAETAAAAATSSPSFICDFFHKLVFNTSSLLLSWDNSVLLHEHGLLRGGEEAVQQVTFTYLRMTLMNLTETMISILALTSVISYQFYSLGRIVKKLTAPDANNNNNNVRPQPQQQQQQPNHDVNNNPQQQPQAAGAGAADDANELLNVGDVAAILFFLLSVQSGLSTLSGQQRIEKFLKNYSLLFIAILHYFHTSLDNQLMTLSASSKLNSTNSWRKHTRVLGMCVFLVALPAILLVVLLRNFAVSTWLLAACAFNIELIVKMLVSLTLYALFQVDSRRISVSYERIVKKEQPTAAATDELSDNLDEYVYYVKAFGHSMEFLVALFLLFNGAYILVFESYGAIRAIMMVIHAYFHIWCQARKGWSVFIKRRTAISKLKSLATFEAVCKNTGEIDERMHDLCPICYCEICAHEARITNCNHLFHSLCLRKWLYLQDTCPMCHKLVYDQSAASSGHGST